MGFIQNDVRGVTRHRNILWWTYFVYLLATLVFWVVAIALHSLEMPPRLRMPAMALMLLDVWAVIGFWGFLRFKALGSPWIWIVCLGIKSAQFFASVLQAAQIGRLDAGWEPFSTESLLLLGGLLLGIPLLIALLGYSLFSSDIWAQPDERAIGAGRSASSDARRPQSIGKEKPRRPDI